MKKSIIIWLIFGFILNIQAQKELIFSFSTGISNSTSEYSEIQTNNTDENIFGATKTLYGYRQSVKGGLQFNLDGAYFFGKLGAGISIGRFNHEINQIDYNLSFPVLLEDGILSGMYFGIGPDVKLGTGKFNATFMLRAGTMNFSQNNDFIVSYKGDDLGGNAPVSIRTSKLDKGGTLYTSTGVKLSYGLSDKFQLFTKVDYFTGLGGGISFNESYYKPFDVNQNNQIDFFDVGHFTLPDFLKKEIRNVKPSMFNVGIGVAYVFGEPKKGRNPQTGKQIKTAKNENNEDNKSLPSETQRFCSETKIVSPQPSQNIYLNKKEGIQFRWKNNSPDIKKYTLVIWDGPRAITKEGIKANSYVADKKLMQIFEKELQKSGKDEKNLQWTVETEFTNGCPTHKTKPAPITIKSLNTIGIDLTDIECLDPAYTQDGQVHYRVKLHLINGTSTDDWTINSVDLLQTSQNLNYLPNCGNTTTSLPITLQPGNTLQKPCFDFSVPVGTNQITFQVNGTMSTGGIGSLSTTIDLPNCICNVCDDWNFVIKEKRMQNILTQSPQGNIAATDDYLITQDMQVLGAGNIKNVRAEVVSFTHKVNDVQCYTCTQNERNMALFRRNLGRIAPKTNWNNHGRGELTDFTEDGLGNAYTWCATAEPGNDLSNNHTFKLVIRLPKQSSLDCCSSVYKVCIRYTYTNMDCKTCSVVVCYEYDTTKPNTTGGKPIQAEVSNF